MTESLYRSFLRTFVEMRVSDQNELIVAAGLMLAIPILLVHGCKYTSPTEQTESKSSYETRVLETHSDNYRTRTQDDLSKRVND